MTNLGLSSAKDKSNLIAGPDDERKVKPKVVGFLELYKYADKLDVFLMIVGSFTAMITGSSWPLACVVYGEVMGTIIDSAKLDKLLDNVGQFLDYANLTTKEIRKHPNKLRVQCDALDSFYNEINTCQNLDLDEAITDGMEDYILYFLFIAINVLVCGTIQTSCWHYAGVRQSQRIRYKFFQNVLRQDIGWFDCNDSGVINAHLAGDIGKIQKGLGESVSTVFQYTSAFFVGYTIGFVKVPKLAGVLVASSPAMLIAGGLYSYFSGSMSSKEQIAYAKAGSIAEEALSSIKTVIAFGGEEKEAVRYDENLDEARKYGRKKGAVHGLALGVFNLVHFSTYAIGLWYGGKLIRDDDENVEDILMVYFTVSLGTFCLSTAAPGFQNVSEARGAAYSVYSLIDQKSNIDSSSKTGKKPSSVSGFIRFRDVYFTYPSRPETQILNGLSLEAKPGQTVALVGASGCGKSTTVQLLLRFYDPGQGQVTIDGYDVRDLNLRWLRQNIGLVSQEPILFDMSIAENIRYGRADVSMDEIVLAAKNANAYDFIWKLPNGFNTLVGERGAQLSGGQKQRIAIARALVRDPKILLLDEATSALDTESESIVQEALDKAREGRTTLVIAHRLSTIRTADIIIGIDKGVVKEKGTHDQLMATKGIYYTLVTNQSKDKEINEANKWKISKEHSEPSMTKERSRLMSMSSACEDEEDDDVEDMPDIGFGRLLYQNKKEWPFLFLGCIGSIIFGGTTPAFALIFSEMLQVFEEEKDEQKDDINKWSLILVVVGFAGLIGAFVQSAMLSVAGEALTKKLRSATFRAMLRQEMAWFDRPKNSTGALTSRLADDASKVQEASGSRLGMLLQCLVAVVSALTLAFLYGWQLTLIILGFFPFLLMGGLLQIKFVGGNMGTSKDALERAGKVAVEAIENMRTVASLTKEDTFLENYINKLKELTGKPFKKSLILGGAFAFSQCVIFLSITIILSYGSYLIENETMSTNDWIKVFTLIMFSGVFMGQVSALSPDIGKAKTAAKMIFFLIDREPTIDTLSLNGKKLLADSFRSAIKFRDVRFKYPTRSEVPVLQGLTFSVEPGQTVALVGSSGCGKSTSIALLERFYDLDAGFVNVDNHEIRDLNIKWLRSKIGLVSQEPVLFDRSIADNIAYGDNSREVKMDEIIKAARNANVHNFIEALPNGYDTNVGEKGTQLSGGQKQRIAIARALLRDPKILLLDEATSALDTESEKIVQEALDNARSGRTCITIAHRLSTIQDADKIVVIHQGEVVEQGTHDELMMLKSYYYRLQTVQTVSP